MAVKIIGTGSYAPDRILTNQDLEKMVETSDEWITSRTGIKERHIAEDGVPTSELAYHASLRALEAAGLEADQLDIISVASITPDYHFPSTSSVLQRRLGTTSSCSCYDVQAACSGLLYSMVIATAMLKYRKQRYALVLGAEKISSIVDWSDRSTCVLFGDAASAVILENDGSPEPDCILSAVLGADGTHADILQVPGGGSAIPPTHESIDRHLHYIKMGGPEVFKLAVTAMTNASLEALRQTGLTVDQVRWIIPHQANKRIIDAVSRRLEAGPEQVYINLDRYGNTSAASIGICLDELARAGKIEHGDHVLLTAFGAGMTWASLLIRW